MQSLTWESCYDGCLAFCIHSASVCLTKGFEWKTFCLCHGTALFSITKKRTNRPNRRIIIFIYMQWTCYLHFLTFQSIMRREEKHVEHLCTFHTNILYTKKRFFFLAADHFIKELIIWTDERVVQRVRFCGILTKLHEITSEKHVLSISWKCASIDQNVPKYLRTVEVVSLVCTLWVFTNHQYIL